MSRTKSSSPKSVAKPKISRELGHLQNLYDESRDLYLRSPLSKSIASMLRTKQNAPITRAVSLGLGSLTSRDQSRRIKQLTLFVAIVEELEISFEMPIEIYAQDPTFTRIDEAFLASLGIQVLRTPSPSDLGEAAHYIDGSTLVYSPFLTIEAYRNVLESCNIGILVGDDFNALRSKWPKFTPEYDNVERLVKRDLIKYQRRLLSQHSKDENVFWEKEDKVFPMALYSRIQELELVGRRDKHPFSAQRGVSHIEKRISAKL